MDTKSAKEDGEHHPWRLVGIGSVALIVIVQFLAFIQGFYIALARLDYHQSMVMLRPTFLYATPFYFFMGRWIAQRQRRRYLFYPLMAALFSLWVNSFLYYYIYQIPLVLFAIDPAIHLVYFIVTSFGGIVGKKTSVS